MNRLVAFLVLVLSICVAPARAALVYDGYPTGPGGLSTPYPAVNPEVYAGLIELNYDGVTLLAMSDDYNARTPVGSSGQATFYTYADVMAGAPVRFTPAQYGRAAHLLYFNGFYPENLSLSGLSLRQLAEANGNDQLASLNMGVWDIMSSTSCPAGWSNCSNADNFDWSNDFFVATLATPTGTYVDEFLIPIAGQNFTLASGTVTLGPVVPLPPAAWLLGSGLVGLAGVARKRHGAPR